MIYTLELQSINAGANELEITVDHPTGGVFAGGPACKSPHSENCGGSIMTINIGEAGDDMELYGWLSDFKAEFDSAGTLNTAIATNIVTRYNEYNQICGWGLEDFDPNSPLVLPGGGVPHL